MWHGNQIGAHLSENWREEKLPGNGSRRCRALLSEDQTCGRTARENTQYILALNLSKFLDSKV